MPDPRYTPRDLISDRTGFGISTRPFWVDVDPADLVGCRQLDAAKLQHEWVKLLRTYLRRRNVTVAEYAERAGYSVDRVERVIRGVVIMRLEDIAAANRVLSMPFQEFKD